MVRLLPPSLCQCSVSRIFKAIATLIRGKWKKTLKSPMTELGNPCSESCALANLPGHLRLQMLDFEERGKPEYPGKNLSEQSREPPNSTHIWRRIRESILEGQCSHHYASPAPQTQHHRCSPRRDFLSYFGDVLSNPSDIPFSIDSKNESLFWLGI